VKKFILFIVFIIIISLPSYAEKPLPYGYGKVKLLDSFEKVSSEYNLIQIGLLGPFKSRLYVLQLEDPYIKEVDFEFKDGRLVWICIRYKSTTGQWNKPKMEGYGDYPFEIMEKKFIEEYGEPEDTDDGEVKKANTVTAIWKIWTWKNEKTVMEFEGGCKFSFTAQGAYVYTQNIYPAEFEEYIKEKRESERKD